MAHHRQVAREIKDEYIDTMSKIYFSYFKTYISKLLKLQARKFHSILFLVREPVVNHRISSVLLMRFCGYMGSAGKVYQHNPYNLATSVTKLAGSGILGG